MSEDIFELLREFGDWATPIRENHGFVWLVSTEADTRTPGGDALLWARDEGDRLFIQIIPEEEHYSDDGWWIIEDDAFDRVLPHTPHPPHLPKEDE